MRFRFLFFNFGRPKMFKIFLMAALAIFSLAGSAQALTLSPGSSGTIVGQISGYNPSYSLADLTGTLAADSKATFTVSLEGVVSDSTINGFLSLNGGTGSSLTPASSTTYTTSPNAPALWTDTYSYTYPCNGGGCTATATTTLQSGSPLNGETLTDTFVIQNSSMSNENFTLTIKGIADAKKQAAETNGQPCNCALGYTVESYKVSSVPLPPTFLLFGSGLIALAGFSVSKKVRNNA
jgi:hypothetical protein